MVTHPVTNPAQRGLTLDATQGTMPAHWANRTPQGVDRGKMHIEWSFPTLVTKVVWKRATRSTHFHLTNNCNILLLQQPQAKYQLGLKWWSCDQRVTSQWRQSISWCSISEKYEICWLLKINHHLSESNSRQNTTTTCCSLLSFQKPINSANFHCFIDALQCCVTVF